MAGVFGDEDDPFKPGRAEEAAQEAGVYGHEGRVGGGEGPEGACTDLHYNVPVELVCRL